METNPTTRPSNRAGDLESIPVLRSARLREIERLAGLSAVEGVLTLFTNSVGRWIETATEALVANDLWRVARAAHSIGSGAAAVGAERLRLHALNLELAATMANSSQCERLLEHVRLDTAATLSELGRVREG
ncbi:MAG: Hpt domain-containing protein [Deltaproteobacteria bacterium]|nr:Hpt domain-containing protein [Deltaproteobacteria bacterium]